MQPDDTQEIAIDDEQGDPAATDTGDAAAVPDDQQANTDESAPNEDAGSDLSDVEDDGQLVDISTDESV